MEGKEDLFYLKRVFPDADRVFSSEFNTIDSIFKDGIVVLDTNVLLVPFNTSKKNLNEILSIFRHLKKENRLYIPARVSREFAKNRGNKISEIFLSISQTKERLNKVNLTIEEYPILDKLESVKDLKNEFAKISNSIKASRKILSKIEEEILLWNWNDEVSLAYKEIFTKELIIEVEKSEAEMIKDLKFRNKYKIPPGFKDSAKLDEGIGDLIVWQAILELGLKKKKDILFVSNDQKNDWFTKQNKIGIHPRYELFDEFRRYTDGQSIGIISFVKLLNLANASKETVEEIEKESILDTSDLERVTIQNIKVGLRIFHKTFGIGEVIKIDGKKDIIATCRFPNIEDPDRRLSMKFAKLFII